MPAKFHRAAPGPRADHRARTGVIRDNALLLQPVRPNVGLAAIYKRKLVRLIEEMARSYQRWVCAGYRRNPPRMAQDAIPAASMQAILDALNKRWVRRFDVASQELAKHFALAVHRRSDQALKDILRKGGISVKFQMTREMRDILRGTVQANVSLIRSIPQQYHTQIEGIVMRSVQTGRDLQQLSRDLRKQFGVTKRRADFIALDQNNKATSALQKARQVALGIEEGVWMHSHAAREPRPTHLANDGKKFDVAAGWFDPDPRVRRRIMPGELINCRCTWKPVVQGFS